MYKGKEKRPKHMQESRGTLLHEIAIKVVISTVAKVIASIILKLVDKYFF